MRSNTVSTVVPALLASIALTTLAVPGCSAFKFNGKKQESFFDRIKGGLRQDRDDDLLADEALDPLGRRDGNRILLDDLSPSQLGTTLKVRTSSGVDQQAAKQAFAKAESLYNSANAQKQPANRKIFGRQNLSKRPINIDLRQPNGRIHHLKSRQFSSKENPISFPIGMFKLTGPLKN